MEKATGFLNMASAVILMVAGLYMQVVFSPLLSPSVKTLMVGAIMVYLVIRVDSTFPRN